MRLVILALAVDCLCVLRSECQPDPGSWHSQETGVPTYAYGVSVVSRNVCWIGGTAGTVIRTTDEGASWASVGGGAMGAADVYVIEGVSDSIALVATTPSSSTYIYRTSNGGVSWNQVFAQPGGFIDGIKMYDRMKGMAFGDPVGGRWTILRTSNGGITWAHDTHEPPQIGGEAGWNGGLATFDTTNIWFGSSSGRLYISTDGGAAWRSSLLFDAGYMWFNTPTLGLSAGNSGVFRTTDGGMSWTPVTNPNTQPKLGLVGALWTTEFWLLSGNIFYSSNAGDSWTTSPPHGLNKTAYAIDMVTEGGDVFAWAEGSVTADTVYHYRRVLTGVAEPSEGKGMSFSLSQNYPDPFNPSTTISFSLLTSSYVTLRVFDVLGREVTTLVNEHIPAGTHSVRWNAFGCPSGVYFYRLQAGEFVRTKKLLLLR